ncbi:MAG: hypothetical protein A3E80_01295 [Chlamydiae bacterium RIFCSPHIGHO2_12_FULL_49_9]|nr:MAG: hypothetical protein A3E80_01295 [Chlamydiae bacterium RIFCSPHIGHO2_12_FULL_49_9]
MKQLLPFLLIFSSLFGEWEKANYNFSPEPIDVVIPCAPKDAPLLELCIQRIRLHGKNIRRVIVVSKEPLTDSAEWFNELDYPFTKEDVALEIFKEDRKASAAFLDHPKTRIGWMLQQLFKLYAPFVIPGISSNVLVLDADVLFVQPTVFMTDSGNPLFALAIEYNPEYFHHASRLLPGFKRVGGYSGIAHHMLFQRAVLEDLFQNIKDIHRVEPWRAICRAVDLKSVFLSPFSEYEIYFNFILKKSDQAILRYLPFIDIDSIEKASLFHDPGYVFVTSHSYNRKNHE